MRSYLRSNTAFRFLPILVIGLASAACDDNKDEDEPDVQNIRITAGTQTVTLPSATALRLAPNSTTAITAAFLRPNGTPEPLVTSAQFRLDVTPVSGSATFTRTGPFAGTITVGAAGTAQMRVALFHTGENHNDAGPFDLAITIQ